MSQVEDPLLHANDENELRTHFNLKEIYVSYTPNTVLERRDPIDPEHPLNVIKVLARSPVKTPSVSEWQGNPSDTFWVVTPHEVFGANEVVPESALNEQYLIREEGDDELQQRIELARLPSGANLPSPEQVFAREAGKAKKRSR